MGPIAFFTNSNLFIEHCSALSRDSAKLLKKFNEEFFNFKF